MFKLTEKKGIELRYWVISLILFSGVFALMVIAYQDAASSYGIANITDSEIEERYDQLANQTSLIENLKETTGDDEGLQLLNVLGTIFTATIGILNLMLSSLTFLPSMFANFALDFGIPTEVTNTFFIIVTLVITTLIIFAIANAIRR